MNTTPYRATSWERVLRDDPPPALRTKMSRKAQAHVDVSLLSLDECVRAHSAFESFADLIERTKDISYRPTLLTNPGKRSSVARLRRCAMAERIADAYDAAMVVLGNPKRAYRGH